MTLFLPFDKLLDQHLFYVLDVEFLNNVVSVLDIVVWPNSLNNIKRTLLIGTHIFELSCSLQKSTWPTIEARLTHSPISVPEIIQAWINPIIEVRNKKIIMEYYYYWTITTIINHPVRTSWSNLCISPSHCSWRLPLISSKQKGNVHNLRWVVSRVRLESSSFCSSCIFCWRHSQREDRASISTFHQRCIQQISLRSERI